MPHQKFFWVIIAQVFWFFSSCNLCTKNNDMIHAKETTIENLKLETFASGLEVPWAFQFANDGRVFINERPGRIRIMLNGKLKEKPLYIIPDVISKGESGLMGLALHPNFEDNKWLYVCYTKGGNETTVAIKRFNVNSESLENEKTILDGIPGASVHVGCTLKFGPDKKLYITTGDATKKEEAQSLKSLLGKTLRLNNDGSIPSDNPFFNTPDAKKEIWSLGHRNAQGLDFESNTGLMFQTEHGPSGFDGPGGGDEINIVMKGKNYGWPLVHHKEEKPGFISPLLEFTPAEAPAGASFYKGAALDFNGNFFFGCLRGQGLMRVKLDKEKVLGYEKLFHKRFGRIRYVTVGPDGAIYFSTSNRDGRGSPTEGDDKIIRWVL